MAHEIFRAISNFRAVLNTETDADSPDNETTYAAMREMIEILYQLMVGTGDDGTATSNPPNDTTGVLTDSAGGYSVDEYNGCTLLMTSGSAKGNTYTIDDTTATTLVCTGDNLYSDGVRSGDYYVVLYDIIANLDGHDHDAINSKAVNLANDSVDSEHYAPASVDQTAIGAAAVGQGELKTTSLEDSTAATGNLDFVAVGSYGFWPQVNLVGSGNWSFDFDQNFVATTYVTCPILATEVAGTATCYARIRYVQASGEVFWLWVLRNKDTKKFIASHAAPDHCSFNAPDRWQPFSDMYEKDGKLYMPLYDYAKKIGEQEVEILVVNLSKEELEEIDELVSPIDDFEPEKSRLQVISEHYDIDDMVEPDWPAELVTVGFKRRDAEGKLIKIHDLPMGTKVPVLKKVIPKPCLVRTAALKRKAKGKGV